MYISKKILFPILIAIIAAFGVMLFMILSNSYEERSSWVYEGWHFPLDVNEFMNQFDEGEVIQWHVARFDMEESFSLYLRQNFDFITHVSSTTAPNLSAISIHFTSNEALTEYLEAQILNFAYTNLLGIENISVVYLFDGDFSPIQ